MTRPNARMILLDTSDSRVLSAAIKSTQLTRAESSRIRTSKNCNNLNLLAGDRVTTTMPRQFRRFSQVLKENERAASKKVETKSYRQHIFPSRRHFAEKREPVYTDSSGACETHFLHAQDPMAEQPALSHHFDPKYPSTDTFVSPKCFSEGALCLSNLSNHNSSHGPKDQGHSRSLSEFKGSFSSSRKANAILMHPVLPIIGGANWIREHKRWRLPTSDTSRPSQVICESSSQRERIAFEKTPTHKPYLNQEHIISTLKPGGMLPQHNWQRYVHPPLAMWNQYRSSSESAVARILINVDSCLGCRKYYGSRPLCAGLGFSSSEKYALSPCSRLLETKTSDSPQYGLQGIQSDYCYAFPLLTHHNLDDDRRFPQGQKSSLSDADLESCVMGSDNSACESCSLSSRDANPQDKSLRRLISTTPIDNEGELKSLEPLIFSREASCLCTDELAWLVDKGRLCISFGANIEIGSCVVEVEAKIFLSKRNFEGWQSFNIPGLFTSTGPNTSIYLNFDVQALRSALIREAPTDKILKSVGSKINLDEFLFDPCSLSGIEASNPNHISGYLQTPTGSLLQLKLKGGVHYVSSWDCAVKLYSVISSDGDERIQIEHFASLLCVPPSKDYFEDIVSFALVVSHGLSSGGSYDLKASEGLIRHNQYPYGREASEHDKHTAKIVVHRKFKDFGKALSICFKCSYPNHEDVSIALPTFRPLFGKVLSEKIWLAKPPPPKTVQRCQRTFLSSWRFTERLVGRIRLMCFDRIRLPPTFPKGFKDNVVIKITHLHPVRFVGLERLDCSNRSIHPYDVVQSAETTIYNVFGGALECRMSLELQVGEVQPLVKIDICDWIPIYSIVGSRLSSELVGEWREIGKRQVGLFRQRWMNVGQRLGVEMCWRQTAQFHDSRYDRNSTAMLECELPKIVDKQVLGGRLACNVENGK